MRPYAVQAHSGLNKTGWAARVGEKGGEQTERPVAAAQPSVISSEIVEMEGVEVPISMPASSPGARRKILSPFRFFSLLSSSIWLSSVSWSGNTSVLQSGCFGS